MIAMLLLFFAAAGLNAQLPETFEFRNVPASITGSLVSGTDTTLAQTFQVRIRNRTPAPPGTYFVTFSAGQSGDFNNRLAADGTGSYLKYQVYNTYPSGNILKDLTASPTSAEVISGAYVTTPPNQTFSHNFTVVIPGNQLPGTGTYTDSLVLTLYDGTIASYEIGPTATIPISFTVAIPTELKMSLVPAGSPFTEFSTSMSLNFGTLSAATLPQTADLIIDGNTPYSVGVTSTNGGSLKDAVSLDTVPYTFTVNGGASITLPAGTQVPIVTAAPDPPAGGTRYSMSFVIGSYDTASAGDYSDSLSFTVTVN